MVVEVKLEFIGATNVTGTRTNNLLDPVKASTYYSDSNADSHLVYPYNGKRISDNKRWGDYETYNNYYHRVTNARDRIASCSNGRYYVYFSGAGEASANNWRGGSLYDKKMIWNSDFHTEISWGWWVPHRISTSSYAESCYKIIKAWID